MKQLKNYYSTYFMWDDYPSSQFFTKYYNNRKTK